jgi:hypothetical protein
MRMRHIVMCGLSGCTKFSTLSHKSMIFEKMLLNIKRVFGFPPHLLPVTYLILSRTERDMIKTVYWSSREISVIRVRL